jgi:carbon monoxide dehydrogenase subunit G
MKVAGQAILHAPVERVFAALNDPAVLVRTIPGCQQLEATGPDAYAMTVSAGVASIKGTYAGTVQLGQLQPPSSFVLNASGAGAPGTVSAEVSVRLTEQDGCTRLDYDADAVVGGVIGGVGQRMLAGVAKKLAGEFFAGVDEVLADRPTEPAPVGEAPQAAGVPSPAGTSDGRTVYRAPAARGREFVRTDSPISFILGAVFGAAAALAGVLVGVRVSRGERRQ